MALAGHKEISLAKEWLIIEPVNVKTINRDSIVLAIDGHTLEPSLLVEAQLVADALIQVTSFHNLHSVRINLTHSRNSVVTLVKVVVECKLGCLSPSGLRQSVLCDHVLVCLKPETCHLYTLYFLLF